jgi:hypothetical protein
MESLYKNENAVVGLKRLYARLKGELKRIDSESEQIVAELKQRLEALAAERASRSKQMADVAGTLQLLSPGLELNGILPVVTRKRIAHLPHGTLRREILAVLRENGGWMTVANLHKAIIQRNGIAFGTTEAERKHRQDTREALHVMSHLTPPRVEKELDLPAANFKVEQRWRLGAVFQD